MTTVDAQLLQDDEAATEASAGERTDVTDARVV